MKDQHLQILILITKQFTHIKMENRNYSILKWCVAILAILNIVLLINAWRKPHDKPMHGLMHEEGGPKNRIIAELKFTPDQIDLYSALVDTHRKAMQELREKGKEIRSRYFALLKQEQPDQKLAADIALEIANNQKEIELVTFAHFEAVRKICSAEQKWKFDGIIGDVLRNMASPGGPPHNPRP